MTGGYFQMTTAMQLMSLQSIYGGCQSQHLHNTTPIMLGLDAILDEFVVSKLSQALG